MSNKSVRSPEIIWWDQVSGLSLFLREAVDVLCEGRHLCLDIPDSMPWKETFFELLTDGIRGNNDEFLFENLNNASGTPGKLLVDHFELKSLYRTSTKYADFLQKRPELTNRIIRVTAMDTDTTRQWLGFLKEYKPLSPRGGLVLLDAPSIPVGNYPRHVGILSYKDFISEYDAQVFAGLLITDNKMTIGQKKYLTTLAASILGTDAAEVLSFVRTFRFDRDSPEQYISTNGVVDNLSRRVWNAQVQILFPLIMQECRAIIEKWRDNVTEAYIYADKFLPGGLRDTNGERIISPDDIAEISTIRFLMHQRRRDSYGIDTQDYILYIPDENARSRVELLYNMRNRIAHQKVCSLEEVVRLLDSNE